MRVDPKLIQYGVYRVESESSVSKGGEAIKGKSDERTVIALSKEDEERQAVVFSTSI